MAKTITREEIIKRIEDENVKYIRLQFTDITGTIKNVEVPVSQIEKVLDNKMMFDGSSIEGFVRIEESDMYLYPDLNTFLVFIFFYLFNFFTINNITSFYCRKFIIIIHGFSYTIAFFQNTPHRS